MISSIQAIQPISLGTIDAVRLNVGEETRITSQELSTQTPKEQSGNTQQGNIDGKSEGRPGLPSAPSSPDFSFIAERLQNMLQDDTSVQFSIDEKTKRIILQVVDNKTNEVIRQLPPEESLKIAQYITGKLEQGKVTDAKI
jgi:flagellar protein FlaG